MYFLPFLPLKAPKWHCPQLYTHFFGILGESVKLGKTPFLAFSKAEMVRNACFHVEQSPKGEIVNWGFWDKMPFSGNRSKLPILGQNDIFRKSPDSRIK